MKLPAFLAGALLLAGPAFGAESAVPAPLPASRYAAMSAKSPFALATAAAPVAEPQASFAANWYIAGIGRVGDSDFVSIKSRDASVQFSLFGREPHPQTGVAVASVNWSETIGKSTVILQKGTEMAKLEFNEAELRGPPPSGNTPGAPPGQVKGGIRPVPGTAASGGTGGFSVGGSTGAPGPPSIVKPPGVPFPTKTTPRPMPVIVTPQSTNQQFQASPSNTTEIRRRVRPIVPPQ